MCKKSVVFPSDYEDFTGLVIVTSTSSVVILFTCSGVSWTCCSGLYRSRSDRGSRSAARRWRLVRLLLFPDLHDLQNMQARLLRSISAQLATRAGISTRSLLAHLRLWPLSESASERTNAEITNTPHGKHHWDRVWLCCDCAGKFSMHVQLFTLNATFVHGQVYKRETCYGDLLYDDVSEVFCVSWL